MTTIATQVFDAVIVGAGGAGMQAALQFAKSGYKVALVSKVFPTRSHTVSAQGGINAALGNMHEDDWRWHTYDTVKGSDYLGDQAAIEYMCEQAPAVIYELEHWGMPFSRNEGGRIYQRPFGGQARHFGKEQAARTCAVADRTGHALLHTLYQKNLEAKAHFFTEWYAIDLVKAQDGKTIAGVIVLSIATGEVVFLHSPMTVLATGGAGQIFESTTNALINSGDGFGLALRAGIPLQDMEMWQFHPTGIAGAGVLVTEGCRGEGGYLINKDGERFMERYAPHAKDLASRDVVARSMALEIRAGRGFDLDGVGCVKLKLDHLGEDVIKMRLPGIRELAKTFAHVDPITTPIPVVPTCHYTMGGIPTNVHGQVLTLDNQGRDEIVPGLYAAGECACVSVHGANRLGGNSLLDLVVFGRAAGLHVLDTLKSGIAMPEVSSDDIERAMVRLNRWNHTQKGQNVDVLRKAMKRIMQNDFGVFRTHQYMAEGWQKLQDLRQELDTAALLDTSTKFNTARIEALELDNLMLTACASALAAFTRTESRGAHSREDFPKRDDANWLKHLLYFPNDTIQYRTVNMQPKSLEAFVPKERVY